MPRFTPYSLWIVRVIVATLPCALAFADGPLFPAEQYLVGYDPQAVAVADLNDDGNPDLVTANGGARDVSLLLGRGDGTFEPPSSIYVGESSEIIPSSIGIADFNGDGALDLVIGSEVLSQAVSVVFNDGAGGFDELVRPFVGQRDPVAVTVSDFDGDHLPDIAVTRDYGGISILFSNGDKTFSAAVEYHVTGTPCAIVAGDLNDDGWPDLAVANVRDTVAILINNGDGQFGEPSYSALNDKPSGITLGDIDGDGAIDVAVSVIGDNTIALLLNRGDGTFDSATYYDGMPGPSPLTLGDVDEDGNLDLAVAANTGVFVLLGFGDGTFGSASRYGTGYRSSCVTLSDVNHDQHLDIISTDWDANTVSVLLNKGDGTFDVGTIAHLVEEPPSLARDVAIGDLNGDRLPDLAALAVSSLTVAVFRNAGDEAFEPVEHYPASDGMEAIALIDPDGDGWQDVVVTTYAGGAILRNNGDGTLAAPRSLNAGVATSVTVADLNCDGWPDIAFNDYWIGISVLLNRGDGRFAPAAFYDAGYERNRGIAAGDLDGDGWPDLAVALFTEDLVAVFSNQGDGTFAPATHHDVGYDPKSITFADLDGDGTLDIATANDFGHSTSVLLNHGDGTFAPAVDYPAGSHPWKIKAGDFNGDGCVDLVVPSDFMAHVCVLLNNGDGTFASPLYYGTDLGCESVAVGDVNGDQRLDIAATAYWEHNVTVLYNRGAPLPGDVDEDGVVDWADLYLLLTIYGEDAADPDFNPAADIDHNDQIDLADLQRLLSNYGARAR